MSPRMAVKQKRGKRFIHHQNAKAGDHRRNTQEVEEHKHDHRQNDRTCNQDEHQPYAVRAELQRNIAADNTGQTDDGAGGKVPNTHGLVAGNCPCSQRRQNRLAQDCKHGSGLTEPEAGANRKNQIDNQRENQTFQLIKSFIRCFAQ